MVGLLARVPELPTQRRRDSEVQRKAVYGVREEILLNTEETEKLLDHPF
jgi:hypothetical protein